MVDGHPLAAFVPADELAYALAALFLGLEMMARLDPTDQKTDAAFAALAGLANVSAPILDSFGAATVDS